MALSQRTREEGRRERRRRETRAALLAAAMQVMRTRGIYGARIEDITERADVAKGVFYHHFRSKEALVAALVSEGIQILDEEYLAQIDGDLVVERVEEIVLAHEAFFMDHPSYALLFHQARGLLQLDARGTSTLRAAFVHYLDRVADPLRDIGIPDSALAELAAVIAGAVAGYRSFRIATRTVVEPAVVAAILSGGVPRLLSMRKKVDKPPRARKTRRMKTQRARGGR